MHGIRTVLDSGCGGSDWAAAGFDEDRGSSAIEYFSLDRVRRYEPARGVDEREKVDCVVSFDVLEHVFVSDVPTIIRDMLSFASKALLLNIACYPAVAKLPNGENAHVTVRDPLWWKGVFDCISIEFPDTAIHLFCSTRWRKTGAFPVWNAGSWQTSETFVIKQ